LGYRIRWAAVLAFYVPVAPLCAPRYVAAARRLHPRPRSHVWTLLSAAVGTIVFTLTIAVALTILVFLGARFLRH
jgi:uncharacterized membrane protein YhaH (DUF805 family)